MLDLNDPDLNFAAAVAELNADPARVRMWVDVAAGWEHTVTDDGVLTFKLDEHGERVPRIYRVHMRPTPREVLAKFGALPPELLQQLVAAFKAGEMAAVIDALGSILEIAAGPWIRQLLDDPTVRPDVASQVIWWLVDDVYGLREVLDLARVMAFPEEVFREAAEEGDAAPFG